MDPIANCAKIYGYFITLVIDIYRFYFRKDFGCIFALVKKYLFSLLTIFINLSAFAQCAMCTKTAAGLDDGAAEGLNNGIIFLAFTPLVIIGTLGFIWFRKNKHEFFS